MEKVCLRLLPIRYGGFPGSSSKSRTSTGHQPRPPTELWLGIKRGGRGGMEKEAFFPRPSCQVLHPKAAEGLLCARSELGRAIFPATVGLQAPRGSPSGPTHHLPLWGLCHAAAGVGQAPRPPGTARAGASSPWTLAWLFPGLGCIQEATS